MKTDLKPFFVYNFYDAGDFSYLKQFLAIISGIFLFHRGLSNLDDYLTNSYTGDSKFSKLWNAVFN